MRRLECAPTATYGKLISPAGTLPDQSNRASNGAYPTRVSGKESYMSGGKIDFLVGKKQLLATLGDSACA
jgi:hypothetical protein